MKKEYTVAQLCEHELNGIDGKTFRRNKAKYVSDLEEKYHVEILGKRNQIFVLTPKKKSLKQFEDETFLKILNCDIGKRDIQLLKLILKSLLEKKVVPTHEELAKLGRQAGIKNIKSKTTVTNYFKFMRDNKIILPPLETPVWVYDENVIPDYDEETGEIYPTYYRKHVNRIYFDYAEKNVGSHRKRLSKDSQNAIDKAYKLLYNEKHQRVIIPMVKAKVNKAVIKKKRELLQEKVLQEVGKAYGLNYCVVIEEPIINFGMVNELKELFGITEEKQRITELDINVSHIEVVNINRPVGISMSELEQMLEYKKLINERVQLYKEKESALPLEMYEKWHGIEFEQQLMKGITEINSSENSNDFNEANDSAVKVNEDNHVVDTCDTQDDFKKQLAAFKFKSNKTVNDGTSLMLSAFMNKQIGA
ncbi:hypothetical protein OK414_03680 [Priestia sp. JV24]|uniref:hypothetical protein n=1 Tax=Priestia TaxID=2800373 RepID=UPI0021D67CDB|nr:MULTISPECIES: hypothetical protein [Priestia]MCU7711126.1 hypothetical protein [Priestia megaterium]MCW1044147.1 hypothetical protein [Priestia sp. JV24]